MSVQTSHDGGPSSDLMPRRNHAKMAGWHAGGAVRVCWVEVAFERGLRKLELRGEDGDVDEVHHFVCGLLLVRHVADRVEAHAPAVGAPREKIDGIMY